MTNLAGPFESMASPSFAVNYIFCHHLSIVYFDFFSCGAEIIIKLLFSMEIKNKEHNTAGTY